MKETELVKKALDWLKTKPGKYIRINSGGVFIPASKGKKPRMVKLAPPGTSDILGCLPNGKFIALEAKIKPNKPTEEQLKFLAEIIRLGGHGCVFYSLQDLKDFWKGGWKNDTE